MKGEKRLVSEEVSAEYADVDLGDARLDRRLERVVAQVAANPAASFPELMKTTADREALYRLLANDRVTLDALIAPHIRETHARLAGVREVRVAHDTTPLVYKGDREGLGGVHRRGRGYHAHVALGISADEGRRPLGVLGASTHVNADSLERTKLTRSAQSILSLRRPREERISSRWEKLALQTSESLPPGVEAIHVMDQEADDFMVFATLMAAKLRFVIRGNGERLLKGGGKTIEEAISSQRGEVFRDIRLNRRPRSKSGGGRSARSAKLSVKWARYAIPRPPHAKADVDEVALTVVHVYEPHPPKGEERVEWYLYTSDPVKSLDDAARIVDHYRARWVVEEYFKALKTGCAIEKRQLTTYEALKRALGLFLPIAWKLLALRSLANATADIPASALFADDELKLLRVLLAQRRSDHRMPESPSMRDAMLAVAAIGGHIKNNGDPGWLVLGRGFQTFVDAQAVWTAARSDQS